jgi:hypothetical protein
VTATGGTGGTDGGVVVPEPPCDDTCHFIRQGATGSDDGSDWDNAWTALPASLVRGHRYFVAAGDYGARDFNDGATGGDIRILKATVNRHGTDTGWMDAYAGGPANFGPLTFSTSDYVFDGGESGGFHLVGEFQGSVLEVSADRVTVRYADIDGAFGTDGGGTHNQGACTGVDITGSEVTLERSEVHDVADDGVSISGATNVRFIGNTVHALHACGTDGGCGPCYNGHSDGIETYNLKGSELVGNFVYDVRSTATLFFGNWADSLGNGPSEYCEDLLIANNVFYAPEVGLVAYIQDAARINVYHNVFWGVRQGSYGGLSVGPNVTDLRLYNNIILSINMAHTNATFNATEHVGDYNLFGVSLGQWQDGPNDIVANDPRFVGISAGDGSPVTNPTPADFALADMSPAIDQGYPGDATIVLPATDFLGRPRDPQPDIGAFERVP